MNLRKDHCRNLHSRTTREPVTTDGGRRALVAPSPPTAGGDLASLARKTNPGAERAKEIKTKRATPEAPDTVRPRRRRLTNYPKRLSATDI